MKYLLAMILLVAPLSAQDIPIPVPDQTIRVEAPPAQVEVMVEINVDSLAASLAAAFAEGAERATASLAAAIAEQSPTQQGPGAAERTVRNVIWVVLGIIAVKKLHDIATRPPNVTNVEVINEGDNVTVNVPDHEPHDHRRKKDHHDG